MHCEPVFFCVWGNVFDKNLRILYEYMCYYMEINISRYLHYKICFSMFNIFNSYAQIYTKPSVLIP